MLFCDFAFGGVGMVIGYHFLELIVILYEKSMLEKSLEGNARKVNIPVLPGIFF